MLTGKKVSACFHLVEIMEEQGCSKENRMAEKEQN